MHVHYLASKRHCEPLFRLAQRIPIAPEIRGCRTFICFAHAEIETPARAVTRGMLQVPSTSAPVPSTSAPSQEHALTAPASQELALVKRRLKLEIYHEQEEAKKRRQSDEKRRSKVLHLRTKRSENGARFLKAFVICDSSAERGQHILQFAEKTCGFAFNCPCCLVFQIFAHIVSPAPFLGCSVLAGFCRSGHLACSRAETEKQATECGVIS